MTRQLQFRLVSVIAGNADAIETPEYGARHVEMLRVLIETLDPDYIIGTCSWASAPEAAIALEYKKILMAQVGPPMYYTSENPYVFGFHINSDLYPLAAVQNLRFHAENIGPDKQPVKVIYRNKSDFFASTCRSAINTMQRLGFTDLVEIEYDPYEDHDNDGDQNAFDQDFLYAIADEACPPNSEQERDIYPGIFMCTIVEQDVLLERWRQNGCRPKSLWATSATWGWASNNPHVVPYLQGGGQWHEAFDYSDRYFSSGKSLLDHNEVVFGYRGSYDHVAGYSMVVLFSQHIANRYLVVDNPTVEEDLASEEGYEHLRRSLLVLSVDTLFGPFALDKNQRNIGRGAAGSQWLPLHNSTGTYRNKLIAPFAEAEALVVIPAPAASYCEAGQYTSLEFIQSGGALLSSQCRPCPVDTIRLRVKGDLQCSPCPKGSSTEGRIGATTCVKHNANLIPVGLKAAAYASVGIVWLLALFFIGWLTKHRQDPVVTISQYQFLVLICVGAMISSSSIIPLSFEADVGEDTTQASNACMTIPFLYTIGWILEYSSLCAKSYRLYRVTHSDSSFRRVQVSAFSMYKLMAIALLLDQILVVAWTLTNPLQYARHVVGTNVDVDAGLVTISSYGMCGDSGDVNMWIFAGPLIFLHVLLMIATNVFLWKNRHVEDRYQELKYVTIASIYMCEILVIGIPVLAAVRENPTARFIVITAIIFLEDFGILCFIMIPKILFVREGLPEGVSVGQSVVRDTMKKAIQRASNASELSKRRAIDVAVAHLRGVPTNKGKSSENESISMQNSKGALGENDAYTAGSSELFLISGPGNGTEGDASLIRQQGIVG